MKDGDLGRHSTGLDQRRIFKGAGGAKAGRADVPATVTLNALSEGLHPVLESLFLRKAFDLNNIRKIFHRLGRLALFYLRGIRSIAATLLRQLLAADDPNRFHPVLPELIVLEKFNEGTLLTAPHHDPEMLTGMSPRNPKENFRERIAVFLIHDPVFQVPRIGEEVGHRMAMGQSQAQNP